MIVDNKVYKWMKLGITMMIFVFVYTILYKTYPHPILFYIILAKLLIIDTNKPL